ncbi:uncharacterized protein [Euphorbia lathyris]|uniref:uncharacterized protein n=1 Tax=Euphorbia lathyris TaxID=212925 RepID=UPI00331389B3
MSNSRVVPKSQIEAMQTVPPYRVTDPRQVLKVSAEDPIGSSIFKASLNIIHFCDKPADDDDDSGWHVAGWIKESLGRALKDEPLLSGRLRRGEDGHGDLEIVSNDSGVRLFEAKIDIKMKDFLALEDVKKAESQLVYWKDIDELNPQFSPLFYVQVTNFQCRGYSIGISCSILFADVLITDNFLEKWATIHRDIVSRNKEAKLPIFYIPNLKAASVNLNSLFASTIRERVSQTVIYKIGTTSEMVDLKENVALLCLEEAEKKLGKGKTSSEFVLLVKESPNVIKARNWKKSEVGKSHLENDEVKSSYLKGYMGMDEVSFREGSKPAMVSYWIGSENGSVQAIAIPSYDKLGDPSHLNVIITIPYENEIIY